MGKLGKMKDNHCLFDSLNKITFLLSQLCVKSKSEQKICWTFFYPSNASRGAKVKRFRMGKFCVWECPLETRCSQVSAVLSSQIVPLPDSPQSPCRPSFASWIWGFPTSPTSPFWALDSYFPETLTRLMYTDRATSAVFCIHASFYSNSTWLLLMVERWTDATLLKR